MITFSTVSLFAIVSTGPVIGDDPYYSFNGYGAKIKDVKFTASQTINDNQYMTLTYSPTLYEKRHKTLSHKFGVDVGVISIDEKVYPILSPWIQFNIGPVMIGVNHTGESLTTYLGASL